MPNQTIAVNPLVWLDSTFDLLDNGVYLDQFKFNLITLFPFYDKYFVPTELNRPNFKMNFE